MAILGFTMIVSMVILSVSLISCTDLALTASLACMLLFRLGWLEIFLFHTEKQEFKPSV